MIPYRHTQTGPVVIALLGGGAVAMLVLASYVPTGADRIISYVSSALLAVTLVMFWRLTVTVDERELVVGFGSFGYRRRFPVSWIRGAEVVRNRWWYGWGIRRTPHGWLFNISGLDAVELTFSDGRKFRVGTDDPEGLTTAVRRVMGGTGATG